MLFDDRKLSRIYQAMRFSRKRLEPFRKERLAMIRQYVGYHYSDNGASDRVPINLIELAVNIYSRQLAAREPKVMVSTRHQQLKPASVNLELALNHLVGEIGLGDTIRRAVMNALFGMGIIKCGMCIGGHVNMEGVLYDIGQPFADSVDLDNWVHDMAAMTFDKVQFCGDRYRVPLEWVMESDLYDPIAKEKLAPTNATRLNEDGGERVASVTRGTQTNADEYMEHVELWDLWLPMEGKNGLVVTLPAEGEGPPLRVVEWDGPEQGPYTLLNFSEVPGNIMPLAPASLWVDLHELANRLYRKLGRQADRQKTVLGVAGAAQEDGRRILEASDGDVITTDFPDKAREYRFGGIDNPNLAFTLSVMDKYSYFAGNLDMLGGLSPQSDTLGQDRLLAQASSMRMADLQDRTFRFVQQTTKALAYYLWTDPLIQLPLTYRVKGTDIELPVTYTPDSRQGDFLDYNIQIEPYSMTHTSPSQKLQSLTQFFQTFIMPFAGMLQQQGLTINFESLIRTVAKFANMNDELADILISDSGNMGTDPGMIGQPPSKIGLGNPPVPTPPVKISQTERVSRPGASRTGNDNAMMQTLLGAGLQNSQSAAMLRPPG